MKIKNLLLSVLLTLAFAITSFVPMAVAAKSYGSFTLELFDTDANVNSFINANYLSGIKIDIYDSVLERYDKEIGGYLYAHNYSYSTYTNPDGTVTFKKPSDVFLVMVDLATLPSGIGIDKDQVFYGDALQQNDSLSLSLVDNVQLSYDSSMADGVRVDIFNASGEQVKADYTVTPDVISNARTSLLDKTYQISGSVTVGSITEYYQYTVKNTGDPIELVAEALETGKISKEEALDFYLEIWESVDVGFCGTMFIVKLQALYEDTVFFNHLPMDKQEALDALVSPSPTRGLIPYGSGYFVIYYEDPGTGIVPTMVQDIYTSFVNTHSKFISGLGYTEPKTGTTSGTPYYNVTVSANPKAGSTLHGECVPNVSGSTLSEIKLYRLGSLNSGITSITEAVIAHEYFHAIMNTYRTFNNYSSLDSWINDSFATWAMHQRVNKIDYKDHSDRINAFLGAPDISLPDSNHYGAGLFPLYIYTYYGGSGNTVIKNIISGLSNSSNTVYTAIGNALSGSSFAQMFSQFWANTYVPRVTYSNYAITSGGNIWNNKPSTNSYFTTSGGEVYNVSCQFIDFWVPNPGDPLTITTSVTSGPSANFRNYLVLKTTYGSAIITDISSGSYPSTYFLYVPSSYSYSDGSIAAVNTGTSGGITFSLNIW